jgi:hypothetical protein
VCDPQRRQQHVVDGAEQDQAVVAGAGAQHGPARQQHRRVRQFGIALAAHLHDGLRRHGPQVVRIQAFQQRFGEFRIIVVEALADPGAHQGHRLDQPGHARIFIGFARQVQLAGRLRIPGAEFARELSEQSQLFFVVAQKLIHL